MTVPAIALVHPVTLEPFFNAPPLAFGSPVPVLPDGFRCPCRTLTGALAVKAPSAPSVGAAFCVSDVDNDAAANPITVNGNGNLIDGAAFVTVNVNGADAVWIFRGALGWSRVIPSTRLVPLDDEAAGGVASLFADLPGGGGGGGGVAPPDGSIQYDNAGVAGGAARVGESGGDLSVGAAPRAAGLAHSGWIRSVLATGASASNGLRARNELDTDDVGIVQWFFDGTNRVAVYGSWRIPNVFSNPDPPKTVDACVFAANKFSQWATSDDGVHGVGELTWASPLDNGDDRQSLDGDLAGRFFFHATSRGELSNLAENAGGKLGETDRFILSATTAGAVTANLVDTAGAELTLPDNSSMSIRVAVLGSRTDAEGGGRTVFEIYVRTHAGAITHLGTPCQVTPDGGGFDTLVDVGLAVVFSAPGGLVLRQAVTGIAAQNYRFASYPRVDVTGGF